MCKWERVAEDTRRLKVPGGWMILHVSCATEYMHSYTHQTKVTSVPESLAFLPDPEHLWIGEGV